MTGGLKPYPTYKDSGVPWLGEVPAHWTVQRTKRVCRFTYGDSLPQEARQPGGIAVHGSNGQVGEHNVANTQAPCLIIGRKGSFGKVNYSSALVFAIDTTFYVDQRSTQFDLRWLYYLLSWIRLDSVSKDSAVPGLDREEVYQEMLPVAPPPEQTAIVRYLDHVDRRIRRYIRAKQKLIALLNEQKQAIIQQAVTRGLDPNVRLKSSGVAWLGEVPEHWEVRRGKYFLHEVDERSAAGEEELLSVSHITGVTPRSQKTITMFMASSYAGHKLCRPGDLVVNTMWVWMGALGVARQTGIVSPSYAVYRLLHADAFVPDFLDSLLRIKPYISEYVCRSTGIRSSRLRVYPEEFLRIPFIRPPYDEQLRIVQALSRETQQTVNAIERIQREITLLREYRTRLIADVVTGKLDVRAAAADLPAEGEEPELPDAEEASDDSEAAEEGALDAADEEGGL